MIIFRLGPLETSYFYRVFMGPDGKISNVWIAQCICSVTDRRGPKGGVCGNCNGAIPDNEGK